MSRSDRLLQPAVVAIGAILRLLWLNRDSYTVDESVEYKIASSSVGEIIGWGDGFPPLYHLVTRVGLWVVDARVMTRVVAALFGIATIWLVWWIVERIAGRRSAAVSALLCAVWPLPVYLSREGRAYSLVIFAAAASIAALVRALDRDRRRDWLLVAAMTAVGMYSHYFFVFAAVVVFAFGLWSRRAEGWARLRLPVESGIVFGLFCLPLLAVVGPDLDLQVGFREDRGPGIAGLMYTFQSLITGFTVGPSLRELHWVSTGEAIRTVLPVAIVAGTAACYAAWRSLFALDKHWRLFAPAAVGAVLPVFVICGLLGLGYQPRYMAWVVVPVLIALGAGLGGLGAPDRRWLDRAAAAVLVAVALFAWWNRVAVDDYRNEDARAAAAVIEAQPDVTVVTVADYMCHPVGGYTNRTCIRPALPEESGESTDPTETVFGPPPVTDQATLAEALASLDTHLVPGERYMLVYSRTFDGDDQGLLLGALIERDDLSLSESFVALDLYQGQR